jgi:hypothetical protein
MTGSPSTVTRIGGVGGPDPSHVIRYRSARIGLLTLGKSATRGTMLV